MTSKNETLNLGTPQNAKKNFTNTAPTDSKQEMNRAADKAASQGLKRERMNDSKEGIFSK